MFERMTLRSRLTLGAAAVLVLVMAGLTATLWSLISGIDERLSETIEARALANAKSIGVDVGFEAMFAGEKEAADARKRLRTFAEEHPDAHSITVLVPAGEGNEGSDAIEAEKLRVFARHGAEVDALDLLGQVGRATEGGTDVSGELVVAVAPATAEKNIPGFVIYTESLSEYLAFRGRVMSGGVLAMVIGLVLIIGGVYLIGRTAARPIDRLVETAERIADGDLREIEIDSSGTAETRRLGESIRRMAIALRSQVSGIKNLTEDVSRVTREVAQAMAHLASSASQQAAAVAETASTVEEMEKAGKSAAGNATQIVDAAEKTTETSIRGRQAVDTTNQIIDKIRVASQDISGKSQALLGNVEEIGNIIGSVNAIAEQSKILAVNASIEAAKAGEYGTGFAVVAQEVKDLAQQSKEATLQITRTLTSIRQAIENMVETASGGEKRTEDGVRTVGNTGAIMNDLSEAIRENSELANVISTSINQQTLGLSQIASAIDEINVSALENQEISRKIEEGTQRMTESMDRLAEVVGKWKTLAEARNDAE